MSLQPVFYSEAHEAHKPRMWFYRGVAQQSRESPERALRIKSSLEAAGYQVAWLRQLFAPLVRQQPGCIRAVAPRRCLRHAQDLLSPADRRCWPHLGATVM